jgi:NADPH-dependent ferric siderophore reductase
VAFKEARKGSTLCIVQVARTQQVSPHMVRVTLTGDDLAKLTDHGYDHWFRLFLPQEEGETNWKLPEQLGLTGYLKYLRMPSATRPVLRNYTVRELRADARELDVDFVVHGDEGPASRWAQRAQPGETVALLDQGRGYDHAPDTDFHLLAGDETALPAILGILRDLPRSAAGLAIIEVPSLEDAQAVDGPEGFEVRWLARESHATPGRLALDAVLAFTPSSPATLSAYVCGEHELPTQARRYLVAAGVPRARITFVGYWRAGKPAY